MICEMCGKEGRLFKALVEGSELSVCEKCATFGKVLRPLQDESPRKIGPKKDEVIKIMVKEEPEETLVDNLGTLVKDRREQLKLKQDQLAKRINEKESLIQKIESGHVKPDLKVARKLEQYLNIKLFEEIEHKRVSTQKRLSGPLTIGDLITIKKV